MAILWPHLRNMNLIDIVHPDYPFDLTQRYDLLVIDDAVYSGHHLLAMFDNMTYELAEKTRLTQKEVGSSFNIHLVVPYSNPVGINEIRRITSGFGINLMIYSDQEVPGLDSYFDINAIYPEIRIRFAKLSSTLFRS